MRVGGDDDLWRRGTHMAEAQNLARELMETPANRVCGYVPTPAPHSIAEC